MRTALILLLVSGLATPAWAQDKDTPQGPQPLSKEKRDEAALRLHQLSSSRWSVRERATKRLIAMGRKVGPMVAAALKKSRDSESQWRMRKVLSGIGQGHLDERTFTRNLRKKIAPLASRTYVRWSIRYQEEPRMNGMPPTLLNELRALGSSAVPILAKELQQDNENTRINVAYLLGDLVPPGSKESIAQAGPVLIAALNDRNIEVRKMAAWSLGRMRNESAVKPLIKLATTTPDKNVRKAMIFSLLPMRSRTSIQPLIELLSKGGELGWDANWVLEKLTGRRNGYNIFRKDRLEQAVKAWQDWYDTHGKTFKFAYSGPQQNHRAKSVHILRQGGQRVPLIVKPVKVDKQPKKKATKKPKE